MTYNLLPRTVKASSETSVSLGAIIQPLARVGPEEEEVPLVDFGEKNPIPRCENCLGYVNHYCTFHDQGHKWKCSICGSMNRTPAHYVVGTDGRGNRLDHDERPELMYGSIDIIAPPLAEGAKPKEPNFLFVLDTSQASHVSGFLSTMIDGILGAIDIAFPDGTVEYAKIGFVTYDRAVQVITSDGIFVMNDLENPFLPVPPGDVLVPVAESERFESLLSHIDMQLLEFEENAKLKADPSLHASGLGSAMFVAEQIMSESGGRVIFNVMHLPTVGVGALKNRDDQNLYGKDAEKALLRSETSWYRDLTDRCVEKSISFDLFFGAAKYCDLVTISEVSHLTGGSLFHYPNFNLEKDAFKCRGDLEKVLTREYGMDAYAVIRSTQGCVLSECYGGFHLSPYQEFRFAQVNSDTTFLVTMEHQEDLQVNPFVIQFAMLYTPKDGIPLIRLHTICRKTSLVMADIFRQTDLEAVMAASAKLTVQTILNPFSELSIRNILKQLVDGCVNVLWSYRKTCAPNSKRGQLILPETLKLMPLYTLSYLKHPSLAPTASIDERVAFLRFLAISPASVTLTCMYPNLYDITSNLDYNIGFLDNRGYFNWPVWKPLTNTSLRSDEVYVMNTGRQIYVCIGTNVPDDLYHSMFYDDGGSIQLLEDADNGEVELQAITNLIEEIRYNSNITLPLQILRKPHQKQIGSIDSRNFLDHLVDDVPIETSGDSKTSKQKKQDRRTDPFKMGYTDFLVFNHSAVRKKMVL